jgi:asparagine synthase (glutamine-hydrolysing)
LKEGRSLNISIPELNNILFEVVADIIKNERSLAVAFSGGVDSTLLAKICKDMGVHTVLLTIGFPGSHDIIFSRKIASKLELSHKTYELDENDFREQLKRVCKKIECKNISHIENCVAFFYIARFAQETGLESILTANGCDELFCGYDKYRTIYHLGKTNIELLVDEKISNEFMLMKEIETITEGFKVKIKQPFLSHKFITFSKDIPIEEKIKGCDDFVRKHILRRVALSLGVPEESAMKRKKALQYGSQIHKKFVRSLIPYY